MAMIRKNQINCKLIREKRPGKIIFKDCMDSFRPEAETCPYCGCKGELRVHAYYGRTLIDFIEGHPESIDICVCRLICDRCKSPSTHAILPDPIIPYCRHSLFFILRVLAEHALRLRSVERICEAFEISVKTFYRWQGLFEQHRSEWQGLLEAAESSVRAAILDLVRKEPFSLFAAAFFRKTGFSILQSHANPARSRRIPFHPPDAFPLTT